MILLRNARFVATLLSALSALFAHAAEGPAGKIVSASGDVTAKAIKTLDSGKGRPLRPGDSISAGEAIITAANASAKVMMTDKTIIDIAASSRFKIDEYQLKGGDNRNVTLSMDYGKIRALVNQPVGPAGKFNVKTKAATMGVRGTEFVVAQELASGGGGNGGQDIKTQITVVKGQVEVADPFSGRPVQLGAGRQLESQVQVQSNGNVVKSESAPAAKVTELSTAQVKATASDAKVEDKTFKQAVVVDNNTSTGSSSGSAPASGPRQGGPGGGDRAPSVLAAVQTSVAAVTKPDNAPPPRAVDIPTPGTFGAAPPPPPTVAVLPGQPVNVRVVFAK